jgi:glutamate--cysteine ligase catalytic subunit
MGLLSLGTPLDWDQARNFAEHVRSHGVAQFVNTWRRVKDRHGDELLWGDEVFPLPSLGHISAMATLIPAQL